MARSSDPFLAVLVNRGLFQSVGSIREQLVALGVLVFVRDTFSATGYLMQRLVIDKHSHTVEVSSCLFVIRLLVGCQEADKLARFVGRTVLLSLLKPLLGRVMGMTCLLQVRVVGVVLICAAPASYRVDGGALDGRYIAHILQVVVSPHV